MNILITGHTGFLGGRILKKLKEEGGHKIIGIIRDDRRGSNPECEPDVIVKGDIRDTCLMRRVVVDYEIEEVYHCAAQAIVRSCANDPYTTYDINVMGTVSLLEACRASQTSIKSVVISTSDKAFGHAPVPYTEETALKPLYTYEVSKACQQMIAVNYWNNYDVPAKVVASSNIYGPGDPNMSRIIPNTITRLNNGEPALLNSGVADYVREFVYVDDVANAFISVARDGDKGGVYCCGGTGSIKIIDLIEKICTLLGRDTSEGIEMFQKPQNFKEIEEQYIDSSKLRSIGWNPEWTLDRGLQESIEYYTK